MTELISFQVSFKEMMKIQINNEEITREKNIDTHI